MVHIFSVLSSETFPQLLIIGKNFLLVGSLWRSELFSQEQIKARLAFACTKSFCLHQDVNFDSNRGEGKKSLLENFNAVSVRTRTSMQSQ